jgi:hypothetical protein
VPEASGIGASADGCGTSATRSSSGECTGTLRNIIRD